MNNEKIGLSLDLRGIDMVTPVDLLSDGRTPWSKNFRLYAQQADDRQVAVSSRKGPGYYMNPLVETVDYTLDEVEDVNIPIGVTANVFAQYVDLTGSGRLNRVDIKLRKTQPASGPVIVSLYSAQDGRPTDLLSQSSVDPGDIGAEYSWHAVRFHKAPLVDEDELYIVIETQDDGEGLYELSGTSTDTDGMFSDVSFAALQPVEHSVNMKVYLTPDSRCKGAYRFNREDGQNVTIAAYGTAMYALNPGSNTWTSIKTGLKSTAEMYTFLRMDGKVFWVNGTDDGLMSWDGSTVEVITHTNLRPLAFIVQHQNRIFGVEASDKNRMVFSEVPGRPESNPANQRWYMEWRSVNFDYIPAPKTGSPITGLVSFQDSLVVFTQDNKYIYSGTDRGNFNLRQSTGSKGALSYRGITSDENFIYFVGDDGFYRFNGSEDQNITEKRIQPLFDASPNKNQITPIVWKNKVRWYMSSQGSTVNDMCALFNPGLGDEWEVDLETYVDRAIHFDDADDGGELLEFSSHYAMPMLAEQYYHSLGSPIDFEYRFKYDSFGVPAQKKRLRRYFPILQGVDSTFDIQIGMDKDFEDSPRTKPVTLEVQGSTWGSFAWDGGVLWGGDKSFQHHRQSYSGSAYYWQLRIARKGVSNRVAFTGAQYKYRIKRM